MSFRLVVTLFVYVLLSDWLSYIGIIPAPLGIKHILLLGTGLFFTVLSKNGVKFDKYYSVHLFILVLYSIGVYHLQDYELIRFSIGLLFTYSGFFLYMLFGNLRFSHSAFLSLLRIILSVNILSSFISIIQAFSLGKYLRYAPGIFRESGAFSDSMSISVFIAIYLYLKLEKKKYLYWAVFLFLVVLSTTLKKSILSVFIGVPVLLHYGNVRIKAPQIFLGLLCIIPFVPALIDNMALNTRYLNNVGVEDHVRLGMYYVSSKIFMSEFPIGSGLGTFGSFGSIIGSFNFPFQITYTFSQVYFDYNIATLAGNSPERASQGGLTFLDTFWPHIFGELGFVGVFLYFRLLFRPLKKLSVFNRLEKGLILSLLITFCVTGIALIQPEVPLFLFYFFVLPSLLISSQTKNDSYNRC